MAFHVQRSRYLWRQSCRGKLTRARPGLAWAVGRRGL